MFFPISFFSLCQIEATISIVFFVFKAKGFPGWQGRANKKCDCQVLSRQPLLLNAWRNKVTTKEICSFRIIYIGYSTQKFKMSLRILSVDAVIKWHNSYLCYKWMAVSLALNRKFFNIYFKTADHCTTVTAVCIMN